MTDNERQFVESITDFQANINKAKSYIKENYGIDSSFDLENGVMHLVCNEAENALMLAAAKEYVVETFNDEIECIMG